MKQKLIGFNSWNASHDPLSDTQKVVSSSLFGFKAQNTRLRFLSISKLFV